MEKPITRIMWCTALAAVAVMLAFAVSMAAPHAAYAEGDQPEAADNAEVAAGSSEDASTGGAEQQDGSTDAEDPVGAQPSAPTGEDDDAPSDNDSEGALPSDENSVGALPERPAGEAGFHVAARDDVPGPGRLAARVPFLICARGGVSGPIHRPRACHF